MKPDRGTDKGRAKPDRKRTAWRIILVTVALLGIAAAVLVYRVKSRLPAGMMEDIRAGIAARDISDPDARLKKYLEVRYGSMDDPANRQKVFLNFFDPEHIKALQLLVKHSPEAHRQASIDAMSRWVEGYRESLTPAEKEQLRAQLGTAQGQAMLRQATAQYNSQSVEYRGQTAPVISQLLKTIYVLQHP